MCVLNESDSIINKADVPPIEILTVNHTFESFLSEKLHKSVNRKSALRMRLLSAFCLVSIIMLVVGIVCIILALNMDRAKKNGTFSNDTVQENSSLGNHVVVMRNRRDGSPTNNFTKLLHPTEYVLISHTAGKFCTNFKNCMEIVRNIQSDQVARLRIPDIGYNFLIGGDGNIYVGRGWDMQNFHTANNSIGVSFIGNFVYDTLTPKMISALEELLACGVKLDKLSPDYKLVCHNQTSSTLSPGENVYKEMVKFSNFYPGPI